MSESVGDSNNIHLQPLRDTVHTLNALLKRLYPDPGLDIITFEDIQRRYRLTGLGALAISAIKQAQRINRAVGHYGQIGLCEFHVGLIYLYWGDCLAAGQQFAEARRQWSFINEMAPVCLAYFAEGRAQHLAFHDETAMATYSKAEQWLRRIRFTVPSDRHSDFTTALGQALTMMQEALRARLWPPEQSEPEEAARQASPKTAVVAEAPTPIVAQGPPAGEAAGARTEAEILAPATLGGRGAAVPLPISNINADPNQPDTPVPAHKKVNDHFDWYEVIERQDNFLPAIRQGSWLLVNTETTGHDYKQGELIVIASNAAHGSIVVRPFSQNPPYRRIYLARLELMGSFTRDIETGDVTLSSDMKQIPVQSAEVVGFVVGFWLLKP